jgi:cytochrome c
MPTEERHVRTNSCTPRAIALVALAASVPLALAQRSWADSPPVPAALVEHHCNACHAVNEQLIGPALLAVSARYGASADRQRTVEVLAEKIRLGGGGNWGIVPMVPNDLSVDEARRLVSLILDLKAPH